MNNELIERMNKVSSRSLDGNVVMDMAEWNAIVDLVDQIMRENAAEVALLRSKIDTLHRLMVTAEKRGASKEAEPVASSQDVEEFIKRYQAQPDGFSGQPGAITATDLRQWMAGHARVKIEPTRKMLDAAEKVDWSDEDTRGSIINMWQAMLAASKERA